MRFNFIKYVQKTDKYGFTRQFHCYQAEARDENQERIEAAYTPGGRVRYIDINPDWEYFKAHSREQLSDEPCATIYARRKIDVESVFGHLKAYLHFTRFTVRGKAQVNRQMGWVLMAMNLGKLAKQMGQRVRIDQTQTGRKKKSSRFLLPPYYIEGFCHRPF